MSNILVRFFQELFSGINPEKIAVTVKSFLAMFWGALGVGAVDVLMQILVWFETAKTGAEFSIDWWTMLRTMAIAALPIVIAYLKKSPSSDGVIYADKDKQKQ